MEFEEIERTGRQAASGDRAALDRLLVGIRPLIVARCRSFLPNTLDADEAAQDALLAIVRQIESFQGRAKFTTWMYQLTTNVSIDCYRKLKRRRSVLETSPDLGIGGSSPSVMAGARIDLLEAAEQLDGRLVELVFMRDVCELEYADIAELLDVAVDIIKSQIHDGRKTLRHALNGAQSGEAERTSRRRREPEQLES